MGGYKNGKVEIWYGDSPPSNLNILWQKRIVTNGVESTVMYEFNRELSIWQVHNKIELDKKLNISDVGDIVTHNVSDFSAYDHNHSLANLSEKSYNSLTDKPIIPSIEGLATVEQVNAITTGLIYQNPVGSFAELATTYPVAQYGWASMVVDEGYIYSYNGTAWKNTGLMAFPNDVALISQIIAPIYYPKNSVDTFSDLENTYPDAVFGWAAYVNDAQQIYSFNGSLPWKTTGLNTFPNDPIKFNKLFANYGTIIIDKTITINYQSQIISFSPTIYVAKEDNTVFVISSQPDISWPGDNDIYLLVYDFTTQLVTLRNQTASYNNRYCILAFIFNKQVYSLNRNAFTIIDTSGIQIPVNFRVKFEDELLNYGTLILDDSITITYTGGNYFTMSFLPAVYGTTLKETAFTIVSQEDITYLDGGGIYIILFDLVTKTVVISAQEAIVNPSIILATFFNGKIYSPNNDAFKVIGGNSYVAPISGSDWVSQSFIFPDNIYLIEGVEYGLHAFNFLKNWVYNNPDLKFELTTPNKAIQSHETIDIQIPFAGNFHTQIVGVYKQGYSNALKRRIDLVVSDLTKTNTSPKICVMGDSLVAINQPYLIKWWLQKFGLTPTMQGTILNGVEYGADDMGTFPQEYGEGRGGWLLTTDYTRTFAPSGYTPPAGNPFINEGVFDFENYATTNGFTNMECFIISLGTNDVNHALMANPWFTIEEVIGYMKTAYTTIINSVHAFNPNIKIGINPPILAGAYQPQFKEAQALWTESLINFIKLEGFENVSVMGNYLASAVFSGKAIEDTSGQTQEDSINDTLRITISPNVHDAANAQYINALWTASWVMNMIE